MAYDKIVDSAYLDGGLTEIAAAIRRKGNTTAALSFPAGMAAAVEAIKAGGGAALNAVIRVAYPVGSVCTASNGSESYTALDSSGAAMFIVEPGTWTVTASDGIDSVSKSVTLTAMGWEELLLTYEFILFPNADFTWTAKKSNSSYSMDVNSERLQWVVKHGTGAEGNNAHFYSSPIDITDFSTVYVRYKVTSDGTGSYPYLRYGFGPDTNGSLTDSKYFQRQAMLSEKEITLSTNISALTGIRYFYIGWIFDNGNMTFIVDSIQLK